MSAVVRNLDSRAIILAAGRGKRLMPLTAELPKCLVRVAKRPILYYLLRTLELSGVRNITVVVGYQKNKIIDYVRKAFPVFNVSFVENTEYMHTNDIYSLYCAKDVLFSDIIILDSDTIFHPDFLSKVIYRAVHVGESSLCFHKVPCGAEEMKVTVDQEGYVSQIDKTIPPEKSHGEFIGPTYLTHPYISKLKPELEHIITKKRGVVLDREYIYEMLAQKQKLRLKGINMTGLPAIEIDFPEDILRAENEIVPQLSQYFS